MPNRNLPKPSFRVKDLTGQTFSRLTVISYAGKSKHHLRRGATWLCKCVCGNTKIVDSHCLKTNGVKSCGCLIIDSQLKLFLKHGYNKRGKPHKIYQAWAGMKSRCKPQNKKKHIYYDRRICVCKRWFKFENFRKDMEPSYKAGLTLDRINNKLGYFKKNCRWATHAEQCRNMRRNRFVTINGITKVTKDWFPILKIKMQTFYYRINKGMTDIEALTTPLYKKL